MESTVHARSRRNLTARKNKQQEDGDQQPAMLCNFCEFVEQVWCYIRSAEEKKLDSALVFV